MNTLKTIMILMLTIVLAACSGDPLKSRNVVYGSFDNHGDYISTTYKRSDVLYPTDPDIDYYSIHFDIPKGTDLINGVFSTEIKWRAIWEFSEYYRKTCRKNTKLKDQLLDEDISIYQVSNEENVIWNYIISYLRGGYHWIKNSENLQYDFSGPLMTVARTDMLDDKKNKEFIFYIGLYNFNEIGEISYPIAFRDSEMLFSLFNIASEKYYSEKVEVFPLYSFDLIFTIMQRISGELKPIHVERYNFHPKPTTAPNKIGQIIADLISYHTYKFYIEIENGTRKSKYGNN